MLKKNQVISSFAFVAFVATTVADFFSANCVGLLNEPEMPQELQK